MVFLKKIVLINLFVNLIYRQIKKPETVKIISVLENVKRVDTMEITESTYII